MQKPINMSAHELMIKTNHFLIKGGLLNDAQKARIINSLLDAKSKESTIKSFKKGVNAPEYLRSINKTNDERVMYPLFFIPPYNNGRKLQTVIPMSPYTQILSTNSYELEILRLLFILSNGENNEINSMVKATTARLRTTCFAYFDCHHGECYHSALIAMRYLCAVSDDYFWLQKLVNFYNKYNGEIKRNGNTTWYFYLCLSELPNEVAIPEIQKYKEDFTALLQNGVTIKNVSAKILQPILFCIMRNCLCRLPEYKNIASLNPTIENNKLYLKF